MGWTEVDFNPRGSIRDALKHEIAPYEPDRVLAIEAHKITQSYEIVGYAAIKHDEPHPVLGLVILAQLPNPDRLRYKILDEYEGPLEYDCPPKILKMLSPIVGDTTVEGTGAFYAARWRERCWKRHEDLKRLREAYNIARRALK